MGAAAQAAVITVNTNGVATGQVSAVTLQNAQAAAYSAGAVSVNSDVEAAASAINNLDSETLNVNVDGVLLAANTVSKVTSQASLLTAQNAGAVSSSVGVNNGSSQVSSALAGNNMAVGSLTVKVQ